MGGAVAIAFAPIFTQLAMRDECVGPLSAALWRVTLACPVMVLWARWDRSTAPDRAVAAHSTALLLPGTLFAADLTAWHAAFEFTTVGNATLLANCAVVLVSVYAWLFLKEHMGWPLVCGGSLALIGVAIVMGVDFGGGDNAIIGDLLALLTAVFYAMYLICMKHLRRTFSAGRIMAWSTVVCALWMLPGVVLFEDHILPGSTRGWLMLGAVALVSHCGGQGLIAYALAHLPASFSAVTLLIQPTGAVLLGWVIFGDALTPLQAVGAGAVLSGIMLARMGSRS